MCRRRGTRRRKQEGEERDGVGGGRERSVESLDYPQERGLWLAEVVNTGQVDVLWENTRWVRARPAGAVLMLPGTGGRDYRSII